MPTDLVQLASRVIDAVAPGHKLVSVTPANAAFTNSVQVLDTLSPAGSSLRLVVKRMTDDPDPERATADFHGLRIARKHGIPAPEPVLLDATGELLGAPGNRYKVRGRDSERQSERSEGVGTGHSGDATANPRRQARCRRSSPHIRRQRYGPVLSLR